MSVSPTLTTLPTRALVAHVAHFQTRVLQDALAEATAAYWLRRAATFEAARPTAQDWPGHASRDELRQQWHRLTAIANACRARAHVALVGGFESPDVNTFLQEVA